MAVPTWVIGQVLPASDLNTWLKSRILQKASDTSRANNATPSADPDLVMALEANATFAVEMCLIYDANSTANFQLEVTGPAGATGLVGMLGTGNGGGFGNTNRVLGSAVIFGGGGAGFPIPLIVQGVVAISSTAGSYSLLWAQGTSNATATILKAGSYMKVTRTG